MIGYKGWQIPEGNVIKVTDANGNVIWSAANSTTTVTMNSDEPIAQGITTEEVE